MAEVFVGNLDSDITSLDIFNNFIHFGEINKIKLPPTRGRSYALLEFKNQHDAAFAIKSWNHKFNWRVQRSHNATMLIYMKNKGVQQSQIGRMEKKQIASTSIWIPPPTPPWLQLPEDITMKILKNLGTTEILVTAQYVCAAWRKICRDPTMWRVINIKLRDNVYYDGNALCRLAVDLSQGQVTEIIIGGFGEEEDFGHDEADNILEYIAKRCGNLKYLGIIYCGILSNHYGYIVTLKRALMGFPLLEELHLHNICEGVGMGDIESISQSCPMLKTFSLNTGYECEIDGGIKRGNEEALGVATFMPELHHLQLIHNRMSNEGLENILNGCPKLESLDLRCCYHLDLKGELEKRCARQVKILRLPHSRIHDFASDVYNHYSWNY